MAKEYEIQIDPRILELLGPNLYTNIYYVLAELIANAYDADAHNVYIIADDDAIRVEDDGHGMSYAHGEVKKYLDVAAVSRTSEEESLTRSHTRRKMGRKGVGKLAALSVSENVDIMTVAAGEKSGFVLSRRINPDKKLTPIPDEAIKFERIEEQGTAIVMRNPHYSLHKTAGAVRRNLLKMFPFVGEDFRIHVIRENEIQVIADFDRHVMSELCVLETIGERFAKLAPLVPNEYPKRRNELVVVSPAVKISLPLTNVEGVTKEYTLTIEGWIGAYESTRGRKAFVTDFPDNFISLFANGKLGEFNILPVVGQNKLIEVYVVGQLHVDLFELTELPDMALSNRQGYKSDDPRYITIVDYVRKKLLADALRKRELWTDLRNEAKKKQKEEEQQQDENALKADFAGFRKKASESAAAQIAQLGTGVGADAIKKAVQDSIDRNAPNLGLKERVDTQKRRVLISHAGADKPLADILYGMLIFNNVPPADILYTSCDDEVSRIPESTHLQDYLKRFFVESISDKKIFVLFVTSETMKKSWFAVSEVGAAWITQVGHKIFNITPCRPEHPLDDTTQWHNTNQDVTPPNELWMRPLDVDIFCQKVEDVCHRLGYTKKARAQNKLHLETLVQVRTV